MLSVQPLTAVFNSTAEKKFDSSRIAQFHWALVVNELVTNAAKYAFPDRTDGHIWVRLIQQAANTALLSVRDDGVELPAGFDIRNSKGLGMRIVTALSEQLDASITQRACDNGKEFLVLFPCDSPYPQKDVGPAPKHASPAQDMSKYA